MSIFFNIKTINAQIYEAVVHISAENLPKYQKLRVSG